MFNATSFRIGLLLTGALSVSACTGDHPQSASSIPTAGTPSLGWRLPKTLLDVTVTYLPKSCIAEGTTAKLNPAISVAIVGRAVPDPDLGPDPAFKDGLVSVSSGQLESFWRDSSFSYKVYPNSGGLLQTLSSHPSGQAGTIIGNFLTGIVKIAGAAVGVPAPFDPSKAHDACATINLVLDKIAALKKKIPTEAGKDAEADAAQIVNLKQAITVTETRTLDTPATDKPDPAGVIATMTPTPEKVQAAGWYNPNDNTFKTAPADQSITIALDFAHANLLVPCPAGTASCSHTAPMPANGLFRQAAYIPVIAQRAGKPEGDPKVVAFGQFGNPRTIPIDAGGFKDISWQVDFADTGEVTGVTYASKARGVAISSAFSGAATSAAAIDALGPKVAAATDSDTLRLQADNAALKAQVDNKTLRAQLELLDAPTSK